MEIKELNSFWPKIDSRESAVRAAKAGAIAFGVIAVGYVVLSAWIAFTGHPPIFSDGGDPGFALIVSVCIAALAAYLAWRTNRRPTLLLNCAALVWILVELFEKAVALGSTNSELGLDIDGSFGLQIIAFAASMGGVRGSLAVRKFGRA